MKSLTLVALLGVLSLSLPQKSIAGAYGLVRAIQSNNIFQCLNGTSWEITMGASNMSASDGSFRMGCINSANKAEWILESNFACQENFCGALGRDFVNSPYDSISRMYTRRFSTVVVGNECTLNRTGSSVLGGGQWSCQKLTSYKNLVVKTIGKTQGVYYGKYINENGNLPPVQHPIVPKDNQQTRILKNSLSCSGSKRFCTRNN
jgi:hypothetical protein